jgi:hypothetical protein
MAKAANITRPTTTDPADYVASVPDATKRADCQALVSLMQRLTGASPVMWGSSIVGFGQYHYRYASGREGDFFLCGFAPRKANLVIYVNGIVPDQDRYLARIGKHKMGRSCLYVKRLADLDQAVLEDLLTASIQDLRQRYSDAKADEASSRWIDRDQRTG